MNSQPQFDVVVVGAGPAGIAAAVRASESGAEVVLVDDNPEIGGQIWRGTSNPPSSKTEATWRELLRHSAVTKLCSTRIVDQPAPGVLLAETGDQVRKLRYTTLILATGARERFLPFPGWTLPNVMGAGGLQALMKSGLPIRGKRVIVAGSGPLLVAVAAYLRKKGAEISAICEQANWSRLAPFAFALITHPEKIRQAIEFRKILSGVPIFTDAWPTAAHGETVLTGITISRRGKLQSFPCDYLACGFHLVPNTELHLLLGCQINAGFVCVDEFQQTTVANVFSAGEPNAIGGVELALLEGQIAGLSATARHSDATHLFSARTKARRFARALDRAFRLRPELKTLSIASTLVCRCEDIAFAKLQQHSSWREAKLHTRCGMGPCQGRICGSATQFLFGWRLDSVRPPIFPARVDTLSSMLEELPETVSGEHS